jgi:hypothetical protein
MNSAYPFRVAAIEARRQSTAPLAARSMQNMSALKSIAAVMKWALQDLESQFL